jgi:Zn finger protein HypA/HybF involved in hydrogenase expression
MLLNNFTDNQIKEFLSDSYSIWEFCKKVGYKNKSSRVYSVIKNNLSKRNINFEDYPQIFRKVGFTIKKTNEEIFSEKSTYERKDLKKKIIKENLLEYKCSKCGIFEWFGSPLSLQLDHINGINNDNRLENLRFLCPNCHTQTPTWGNKKRKEGFVVC